MKGKGICSENEGMGRVVGDDGEVWDGCLRCRVYCGYVRTVSYLFRYIHR